MNPHKQLSGPRAKRKEEENTGFQNVGPKFENIRGTYLGLTLEQGHFIRKK